MTPNRDIVSKHRQIFDNSCVPMSIELVLKLLGRIDVDKFPLQDEWGNRSDAGFGKFAGKDYTGVVFTQEFTENRGDTFPLEKLFARIKDELALGKYVVVSLANAPHWHMYVVYDVSPTIQEFLAVSEIKGSGPIWITDVRKRITDMRGTDILTYHVKSDQV